MENELSKGFTGIEINGVRFSTIGEMLRYMDRQREQLTKAKKIIQRLITKLYKYTKFTDNVLAEAEQFLKETN